MKTGTVYKISKETNQVKLYIEEELHLVFGEYYAVANPKDTEGVEIGDKINYEPEGFNFGWFVKKLEQKYIQTATRAERYRVIGADFQEKFCDDLDNER